MAPDAGRRRPSAGRHRWMPPRRRTRRLDAEKRRSYDIAAAVAPLASWMPATPSNVHTLTGMRLCGAAACGGVATARRWRRRRGDVKTDEKSSATNRAILSLVVLMKPLGLFSRALTLTQEKSCILPIGAIHKRRRGHGAARGVATSKLTKNRRRQTALF